jgi:hypothetical protein
MDAAAMATRCPRSRLLGRARLAGFRPIVMPSGFVSVALDRRMSVHGVLWDVAVADVAALDRYEDLAHGLYAKEIFPVLREPVGSAMALTYVGVNPNLGAAGRFYLEGIVAAARAQALHADYIDYLSSLLAAQ